ncbi:hypothetical protein [Azonexus hydrophilus]|uniref:Uncharacterized protein n=1 Tax=Azonexus hydrophilus TaxID=418702 RepID=A0ABZ2XMN5_9RHOO
MNKSQVTSIAKYALIAATLAVASAYFYRHFLPSITTEEAQAACREINGCKKAHTSVGYDKAGHRPLTVLHVVIDRKTGGQAAASAFEAAIEDMTTPRKLAMSMVGVARSMEVRYE